MLPSDTIAQLLGTSVDELNPAPVPIKGQDSQVGFDVIDVDVVENDDE